MKNKEWQILLEPLSPFHLGDSGGLTSCALHPSSDTVWSALVTIASLLKKKELIEYLKCDNCFLLSSLYPTYNEFLFFPKPLIPIDIDGSNLSRFKAIKQARFVSKKVFDLMLSGGTLLFNKLSIIGKHFLVTSNEAEDASFPEHILRLQTTSGVAIDRITGMAVPYGKKVINYNSAHGVRLFVRIVCDDKHIEPITRLLSTLGQHGLGGLRSTGHGAFKLCKEPEEIKSAKSSNAKKYITLSLYHPTKDEIKNKTLNDSYYKLADRGGWVDSSSLQKQRLKMITEGSYINTMNVNKQEYGSIVPITPGILNNKKEILRYGKAYPYWI